MSYNKLKNADLEMANKKRDIGYTKVKYEFQVKTDLFVHQYRLQLYGIKPQKRYGILPSLHLGWVEVRQKEFYLANVCQVLTYKLFPPLTKQKNICIPLKRN